MYISLHSQKWCETGLLHTVYYLNSFRCVEYFGFRHKCMHRHTNVLSCMLWTQCVLSSLWLLHFWYKYSEINIEKFILSAGAKIFFADIIERNYSAFVCKFDSIVVYVCTFCRRNHTIQCSTLLGLPHFFYFGFVFQILWSPDHFLIHLLLPIL